MNSAAFVHCRRESNMVFSLIGVIGMILFLLPYFTRRVHNIGNVTGVIVCICFILYGIFYKKINAGIAELWKSTVGKIAVGISGTFLLAVIFLAAVETCLMIYSANDKPQDGATVVVLGCRVYGEQPSLMLEERLVTAENYLKNHPESKCILSGGQGSDEGISEAECMYRYLTEHGIDKERLYMEDRSTSTRENLAFSREIIEENKLDANIAIVTNEFHEYRAQRIAKALGMDCSAVSAATAWWLLPTFYVRELYGILYEWIL
jgi:uncharacterized SAM-binding protein YcdF (DUF218 family)